MNIAMVVPRNTSFGPESATATDLDTRDFVLHSRYATTTRIITHPVDKPFPGFNITFVPRHKTGVHSIQGRAFAEAAIQDKTDLVVVQQHVPTAIEIARRARKRGIPVILHRHANVRPPKHLLGRLRQRWLYSRFTRTLWVSHYSRGLFLHVHPALANQAVVMHNGLDMEDWHPARERAREVLFVGRAHPEKGAVEAAQGAAEALQDQPDWHARFILGRATRDVAYTQRIKDALAPLGTRAEWHQDVPHAKAKAAFERAAIALVPSVYEEPFGRTALEAFAGGAAVVTSARGGLSEIVGDLCVRLAEVTPTAIAETLRNLMADQAELRRLSDAGRKRAVEQFDIRVLSARLDALYDNAVR